MKKRKREKFIFALTPQQANSLVSNYKQGLSKSLLAKKYSIHTNSVANYLKRAGIKLSQWKLTKEQIKKLIREYFKKPSATFWAKKYQVSFATICNYLRRAGIKNLRLITSNYYQRENVYNWKGGRHKMKNGYIQLVNPPNAISLNKYNHIYEHRHIMEQHLGRKLRKDEHLHHINGDRTDNRLNNLKLMSRSEHLSMETKDRLKRQRELGIKTNRFVKLPK